MLINYWRKKKRINHGTRPQVIIQLFRKVSLNLSYSLALAHKDREGHNFDRDFNDIIAAWTNFWRSRTQIIHTKGIRMLYKMKCVNIGGQECAGNHTALNKHGGRGFTAWKAPIMCICEYICCVSALLGMHGGMTSYTCGADTGVVALCYFRWVFCEQSPV